MAANLFFRMSPKAIPSKVFTQENFLPNLVQIHAEIFSYAVNKKMVNRHIHTDRHNDTHPRKPERVLYLAKFCKITNTKQSNMRDRDISSSYELGMRRYFRYLGIDMKFLPDRE